jgi:hypothetical protein
MVSDRMKRERRCLLCKGRAICIAQSMNAHHPFLKSFSNADMVGFDGIGDVVFAVLQKVMEAQASSHNSEQQLVVNKAPESRPSEEERQSGGEELPRDMHAVDGFTPGWELAEVRGSVFRLRRLIRP